MTGEKRKRRPQGNSPEFKRALRGIRREMRKMGIIAPEGPARRGKDLRAAILEDVEARYAFRLLVGRGFAEDALLASLCDEAWGPGVIEKSRSYALSPGEARKKSKMLFRLASRLRKTARQFRQPEELTRLRLAKTKHLPGWVAQSPHPVYVLNRCAAEIISAASHLRQPYWMWDGRRSTMTEYTRRFLHEIRQRTGHYSLERVAALLRVSHRLAQRPEGVSRESLRALLRG